MSEVGVQNFRCWLALAPSSKLSPERSEPTRFWSEALLHLCPAICEEVGKGAASLLSAPIGEN